jgi:uncharacterized protein (TIGR03382 family)
VNGNVICFAFQRSLCSRSFNFDRRESMRRNTLLSSLVFCTTLGAATAALACRYPPVRDFAVIAAVSADDTTAPEVATWSFTFEGPREAELRNDGACEPTSCGDLPILTVSAQLAAPPEWPLEGSVSSEGAAAEGITPGIVIETTGTVPCADAFSAISANPIAATGDLFGSDFSAQFHWSCRPDATGPWEFQVRAAFVDLDGDVGTFSEWTTISGDPAGCNNAALSGSEDTEAEEESGCSATPGASAPGSLAFLLMATVGIARRRSLAKESRG